MVSPSGSATRFMLTRRLGPAILVACLAVGTLPIVLLDSAPAAAAGRAPQCPPDCGAVAAGDPLLVPFMVKNPGSDWQAFPAAESRSYVNSLRRNLDRLAGPSGRTNVAVARWNWVTGKYGLLITLVSSRSLASVHLHNPIGDAADLCSSAGGEPTGPQGRSPGSGNRPGDCARSVPVRRPRWRRWPPSFAATSQL